MLDHLYRELHVMGLMGNSRSLVINHLTKMASLSTKTARGEQRTQSEKKEEAGKGRVMQSTEDSNRKF